MPSRQAVLLLVASLVAGCATSPSPSPIQRWVDQQGGLVNDPRQQRVAAAAQPVLACCHGRSVTIAVFASDQLCAFAWPSGHIFISRGLVDHLTDHELAAAIAHELGHLLCDGRLETVVSLKGTSTSTDREVRADAAGLALLYAANIPPQSMLTMLQKVCASVNSTQCRTAMQQRIQLLSLEIASTRSNNFCQ